MIPFNKSFFTFLSLIKAILCKNSKQKLEDFFRNYTGKKYVLVTNSCRSALYLTYKCIESKGEIITSPLACKVAIDPIIAGDFKPVFADIEKDTLTLLPKSVSKLININSKGIQLTHLGGFACKINEISLLAKKNKLIVVEDCAQGLFSLVNGTIAGTKGDYICFTLIKNAKGIGGGILATNDKKLYKKALSLQALFPKPPLKLIAFRVIRGLLENHRDYMPLNFIYKLLMNCRPQKTETIKAKTESDSLKLYQPSLFETKIACIQFRKALLLKEKRIDNAARFMSKLKKNKLMKNYKSIHGYVSSFVKLYMYNQKINSAEVIKQLNKAGIEAMHLENKYGVYYQERLDKTLISYKDDIKNHCPNYLSIHDHLVVLPFYETLSDNKMDIIVKELQSILH